MTVLSPDQVATALLQAASEMGVQLTRAELVGLTEIPSRESGYDTMAHNPNRATGDDSYGLWQINMLGQMGADRARSLGISDYTQLYDPVTSAKGAIQLVLSGRQQGDPLRAWGGYKGMSNTYNVSSAADAAAQSAVDRVMAGGGTALPSSMGQTPGSSPRQSTSGKQLVDFLNQQIGKPYIFGSSNIANGGFDCLAAGTLIATDRGEVPIEQVTTADQVWTSAGYRRVLRAWKVCSGADTVIVEVDGRALIGTPDHRVWTENRGWTPLVELQPFDILVSCRNQQVRRNQKSGSSTGSSSTVIPNRSGPATARTSNGRSNPCTAPSGAQLMARSPRAMRSTIVITTPSTTTSPTSLSSRYRSIGASRRGRAGCTTSFVLSAAPGSRASRSHPANAASAVYSTSRSSITAAVRPSSSRSDVYDLTVEDQHEFFADGVLVHNCSGLVTAAYKQLGIDLPPLTFSQMKYGTQVSTNDLQPGDLMFRHGSQGDFGHMGVYIGGGQVIAAPYTGAFIRAEPAADWIAAANAQGGTVRRIIDGNGSVIIGDGLVPQHSPNVGQVTVSQAMKMADPLAPNTGTNDPFALTPATNVPRQIIEDRQPFVLPGYGSQLPSLPALTP